MKSSLDWKNEGSSSKASERTSDWAADFKKVIQSYFAYKISKFIFLGCPIENIYFIFKNIFKKILKITCQF